MAVTLGCAVAIAALVVVGIASGVRFAPHSREQASLAKRDAVWARVPSGMHESGRFTHLADAAWVPPTGTGRHPSTVVGHYYQTNQASRDALVAWDGVATGAGWRPISSGCTLFSQPELVYEKTMGGWRALLTASFDAAHNLLIEIRLPETAGATASTIPAGVPAC